MGLPVEENLQPVLDPAQEAVVLIQDAAFLGAQAADLLEPGDGGQRRLVPHFGILTAVEQLQELDHELDVADARRARS